MRVALDDAEEEWTAEGVVGLRSLATAQLLASQPPKVVNDAWSTEDLIQAEARIRS